MAIAVVTGGAHGIGKAIVKELQKDYKVFSIDLSYTNPILPYYIEVHHDYSQLHLPTHPMN